MQCSKSGRKQGNSTEAKKEALLLQTPTPVREVWMGEKVWLLCLSDQPLVLLSVQLLK